MNKKIIAAAIAAVVAAPAVSAADTTLYGRANVSIQSNDSDANGDNYSTNSNASRIGIKGSEDLGDGLKAVFAYEMDYNMTDGGAAGTPITARNAFVGLSGGFGTFVVGRHDTPAKMALYSTGLEVVPDAVAQMINADYGLTERRLDNAIAYVSPSFSGFTVAGAIVPGEQSGKVTKTKSAGLNAAKTAVVVNTNTNTNGADGLTDAYSLGLMYAGGGLKASLGYEVASNEYLAAGATAQDDKFWQAAASYTFGDFMVGGVYENHTDTGGVANNDFDTWGLMGKATFGNNFVTVNYTNQDYDLASTTTVGGKLVANGGDNYGIQLGHNFSKRTMVYAAYEDHSKDAQNTDSSNFALGMIHNF